jgi:hypothetical protein
VEVHNRVFCIYSSLVYIKYLFSNLEDLNMNNDKQITPIDVYIGTLMQASRVKTLLENAEIDAFIKDEIIGTVNPWHAAPEDAGAVKLFVSSMDFETAKKVVSEYESNLNNL